MLGRQSCLSLYTWLAYNLYRNTLSWRLVSASSAVESAALKNGRLTHNKRAHSPTYGTSLCTTMKKNEKSQIRFRQYGTKATVDRVAAVGYYLHSTGKHPSRSRELPVRQADLLTQVASREDCGRFTRSVACLLSTRTLLGRN
jgi:hypothetical protein